MRKSLLIAATAMGIGAFSAGPVLAANPTNANGSAGNSNAATTADALLNGATRAIDNLNNDHSYAKLMHQAKGVFIVPNETTGALGIGGQGGQGVLLKRTNNGWSNPAFMSIGTLSLGPQAGVSKGETVMLLMTRKAMDDFVQANNFSLGASAGLHVAGYTGNHQAPSQGNNDVVVWSNHSGAYVGANIKATDISANSKEDQNFYNKSVSTQQILNGDVSQQAAAKPLISSLHS
ncbi:MAG TPA: lipid-binding SYLF domain-containing protein [Rhodopila sp.]|nr:lipid-binding SYLF domain-containing protein [Rhodopila sp.]